MSVFEPLCRLQGPQAATTFSQVVRPPRERGHDVVEGQVIAVAAVLAGELVAQEEVEAGEGGGARGLHVVLEHDHRGYSELDRRRVHQRVVFGHDHHPVEDRRLDRLLPRPERQRQVGERAEVGVQDQRRMVAQPAGVPDEAGHVGALQHRHVPRAGRCGPRRRTALRLDHAQNYISSGSGWQAPDRERLVRIAPQHSAAARRRRRR